MRNISIFFSEVRILESAQTNFVMPSSEEDNDMDSDLDFEYGPKVTEIIDEKRQRAIAKRWLNLTISFVIGLTCLMRIL